MRDVASAAPTGGRAPEQVASRVAADPPRLEAARVLALQRTAGNRAVGRLLQRYSRDAQGRILDHDSHPYAPIGTQRTRLRLWVDGFLGAHDYTPLPRDAGPISIQRATLEGETHTVREIEHLAATEAAIDFRAGQLTAPVDTAEVAEEVRQVYYDTTNPGVIAPSVQVAPIETLHIPLGGGAPFFDVPGFQAAVAVGIPTMRANQRGWLVTLTPSQLSFFGDGDHPERFRLQSWLGGVQLGYAWPINRTLILQAFAQAMGGMSFPHAGDATAMPQAQGGGGISLMWTLPAGFSMGGQVATTYTHTFFLPGHLMPGDAADTLDIGAAFVVAWGTPMGAFGGLSARPER